MKKYSFEWGLHEHDFRSGAQVKPVVVQQWVNAIVPFLMSAPAGAFRYTRSGNSLVVGLRSDEDITVFIIDRGYKEMTFAALGIGGKPTKEVVRRTAAKRSAAKPGASSRNALKKKK